MKSLLSLALISISFLGFNAQATSGLEIYQNNKTYNIIISGATAGHVSNLLKDKNSSTILCVAPQSPLCKLSFDFSEGNVGASLTPSEETSDQGSLMAAGEVALSYGQISMRGEAAELLFKNISTTGLGSNTRKAKKIACEQDSSGFVCYITIDQDGNVALPSAG